MKYSVKMNEGGKAISSSS